MEKADLGKEGCVFVIREKCRDSGDIVGSGHLREGVSEEAGEDVAQGRADSANGVSGFGGVFLKGGCFRGECACLVLSGRGIGSGRGSEAFVFLLQRSVFLSEGVIVAVENVVGIDQEAASIGSFHNTAVCSYQSCPQSNVLFTDTLVLLFHF